MASLNVAETERLERFFAFCSSLVAVSSFEDAVSLFKAEVQLFGVDGFAFGEVQLGPEPRALMLRAEWPAEWLDFYMGERLFESDPLFPRLQRSPKAFTWEETFDAFGPKARWRQAVTSFGWKGGVAVPIPSGQNRIGLVSLASTTGTGSAGDTAMLATLAGLFYERARGLSAGLPSLVLPGLTAREVACLEQVLLGRNDAAIGLRLGIAASTAHEHVERAKRKLGARTRAEAVGLAVGYGIIAP